MRDIVIYGSLGTRVDNSTALKGEHAMNSFVGFKVKTILKRTLEHNGNAMKSPTGMADGDICALKKGSKGFGEKCHSCLGAR